MNAAVALTVRSNWRQRWPPLIGLALIVALGGGAASAAAAGAHRSDTAFGRLLLATNAANIDVFQQAGGLEPALLDKVMAIDGVRGASEIAFVAVTNPAAQGQFFSFAVVGQRGVAETFVRLRGRTVDFATMTADEVVADETAWAGLGVSLDEPLSLPTLTQEQFAQSLHQNSEVAPSGPTISTHVVAVGRLPDTVTDAPDPILFFPPAWFTKYGNEVGSCVCTVRVSATAESRDAVIGALASVYPSAVIGPTEDLGGREFVRGGPSRRLGGRLRYRLHRCPSAWRPSAPPRFPDSVFAAIGCVAAICVTAVQPPAGSPPGVLRTRTYGPSYATAPRRSRNALRAVCFGGSVRKLVTTLRILGSERLGLEAKEGADARRSKSARFRFPGRRIAP